MVRLTDRPDMTLDVYRGRKTTMQQLFLSYLQFCCYIINKECDQLFDSQKGMKNSKDVGEMPGNYEKGVGVGRSGIPAICFHLQVTLLLYL